jgi:hypothetical protein
MRRSMSGRLPGLSTFNSVSPFYCIYLHAFDLHLRFKQGDQMGRIFARWVIVFFGQFTEEAQIFGLLISTEKVMH